jgi:hypothetical protein
MAESHWLRKKEAPEEQGWQRCDAQLATLVASCHYNDLHMYVGAQGAQRHIFQRGQ